MAIGREAREQWPWLEKSEIRRSSNSTTLGVHRADKQGLIKYNLRIIHYHIKSHLSSREKIYDREGVNKIETEQPPPPPPPPSHHPTSFCISTAVIG